MKSVYTGGEKVAEFESYDELRVGDGKPAFIYEGSELVYPNPVKDGLVLWYDFSGRTNADGQRGIAEDLSGNGNHGTLKNFNYTPESGYDKNKLLFDGIDDYLQVPETRLNPKSMAIVNNGKIYSYDSGIVTSVGDNGDTLSGGINLIAANNIQKNAWIGANGNHTYSINSEATKKPILVTGGETLYLSRTKVPDDNTSLPNYWRYAWHDSNDVLIERLSESKEDISLKVPDDAVSLLISWAIGAEASISRHSLTPNYAPSSQDYLTTIYKEKGYMFDLLIYNRPLTPEEIAHNYAIEKERFNIE